MACYPFSRFAPVTHVDVARLNCRRDLIDHFVDDIANYQKRCRYGSRTICIAETMVRVAIMENLKKEELAVGIRRNCAEIRFKTERSALLIQVTIRRRSRALQNWDLVRAQKGL